MSLFKPTISVIESGHRKVTADELVPEESGMTRTDNNLVLGAKFETVDWHEVASGLVKLQKPVEDLMRDVNKLTISEYILQVLKIHHRITQIYLGRCSFSGIQ